VAVAVLRDEQELRWEFKSVIPSSATCVTIDESQDLKNWSVIRRIDIRQLVRLRSRREFPLRHQVAAAQLLDSDCKVLLATDREIHFLNSLAELCPQIHQVIVGHGVLTPLNVPRMRITRGYPNRSFFVWGRREEELLKSLGLDGLNVVRLGSLRNAVYLSETRTVTQSNPICKDQICLVSSFVGLDKENQREQRFDARWELRQFLFRAVSTLAKALDLPVLVALKPPTMRQFSEGVHEKWADERQYFVNHLPDCDLKFTEPSDRYSTYRAIDESRLTLGLFAGSVVEGFGRGRLVISAGTEKLKAQFGALPDQLHITERSVAELTSSAAFRISDKQRWIQSSVGVEMRRYYVEDADGKNPILRVSAIIADQLGR
jgi:hypothetical protein